MASENECPMPKCACDKCRPWWPRENTEVAKSALSECERLRTRVAELEALKPAAASAEFERGYWKAIADVKFTARLSERLYVTIEALEDWRHALEMVNGAKPPVTNASSSEPKP